MTFLLCEMLDRIDKLRNIAGDIGATLLQPALAWTIRYPAITSAIIGASKSEQVIENGKASDCLLSQDIS